MASTIKSSSGSLYILIASFLLPCEITFFRMSLLMCCSNSQNILGILQEVNVCMKIMRLCNSMIFRSLASDSGFIHGIEMHHCDRTRKYPHLTTKFNADSHLGNFSKHMSKLSSCSKLTE